MRRTAPGPDPLPRLILAACLLASGLLAPFAEEAYDAPEFAATAMAGRGPAPLVIAFHARSARVAWAIPPGDEASAEDDAEPADPAVPANASSWSFLPAGPGGRDTWLAYPPPAAAFVPVAGPGYGMTVASRPPAPPTGPAGRSPLLRC